MTYLGLKISFKVWLFTLLLEGSGGELSGREMMSQNSVHVTQHRPSIEIQVRIGDGGREREV